MQALTVVWEPPKVCSLSGPSSSVKFHSLPPELFQALWGRGGLSASGASIDHPADAVVLAMTMSQSADCLDGRRMRVKWEHEDSPKAWSNSFVID